MGTPGLVIPALALGLSLVLTRPAQAQESVTQGRPATLSASLTEYLSALTRLRNGDDEVLEELRRIGRHLCERFDRCDALDVLEFYAGLSPEERRQGLEDEASLQEIRDFVWELSSEGLPDGESWEVLREEICGELADWVAAHGEHADFTPTARAHALWAEVLLASDAGTEGSLREVRTHVDRAVELFERAGQLTPQLDPLWLLGRILRSEGETLAARGAFERCHELALHLGRGEYRERALLGLVDLAKDAGDWREVDRRLAQIASFRSPDESWPLAREHATRLVHQDQPEATLRFLLNYPPQAATYAPEWHTMLASAFLRAGDLDAARREMLELDEASQELRELTHASLELAQGNPHRVLERLEALASEPLSADAGFATWSPHGRVQAWSFLGEACLKLGEPGRALAWLERAARGADRWDDVRSQGGQGSVIGEWLGLHVVVLLAEAHAELGAPLEAARTIEEYQSRRLRGERASQGLREERVTTEDLLSWSARFEGGLVTWILGAESGMVAHVAQDGEARAAKLHRSRQDFQVAVRRLREAAIGGDAARASDLAREVAAEMLPADLREVWSRLPTGAATLFLLHGPLEALPLALLDLDGRPLNERLTPLVLPGLTDAPLHEDGSEDADPAHWGEWTLLGSPVVLDDTLELLLPGAARELVHLGRLHPDARTFTGATFTKRAAFDALSGSGPVHIATHLVEDDRCLGSTMAPVGLQLSGGDVLCAMDIEALHPRLPLVVLTACDTAGGRFIDGEGLHGISRAFLESGTASVVATLWPVEDGAALDFARRFHTGLLQGTAPADACAAACRAMRTAGNSPADWAAFRFLGRR